MPPGHEVWIFQVMVSALAVPTYGAPSPSATAKVAAAAVVVAAAFRNLRRGVATPSAVGRGFRVAGVALVI